MPGKTLLLAPYDPAWPAADAREKLRVAEAVGWDKPAYSEAKGPFIEAPPRGEGPPGGGA